MPSDTVSLSETRGSARPEPRLVAGLRLPGRLPCASHLDTRPHRLLRGRAGVSRLIDAELAAAWERDLRDAAPILLADRAQRDLLATHLARERVDVFDQQEQLVAVVPIEWMHGHFRRRERKDEPASPDVDVR